MGEAGDRFNDYRKVLGFTEIDPRGCLFWATLTYRSGARSQDPNVGYLAVCWFEGNFLRFT